MRAIFVQTLHIFLILFQNRSITFHCNWVSQNADTSFSALGPETVERIKLAKDKIYFDLALKRWFGRSHLEVVKNSTIHLISKLLA